MDDKAPRTTTGRALLAARHAASQCILPCHHGDDILDIEAEACSDLDAAWSRVQSARPEGWIVEMYDQGEHSPFNPAPSDPFGSPRYHALSKLGILSSLPKHHGESETSLAEALTRLAEQLEAI